MPAEAPKISPPDEIRRLGNMLSEARIDSRLTQEQLAHLVDMHPSHLSSIERGLKDIRYSTVVRLVGGMGMALDAFYADYYAVRPGRRRARGVRLRPRPASR